MTSYYDIKKLLCEILRLHRECEIGGNDDIVIPVSINGEAGRIIKNDMLKAEYDKLCKYKFNGTELYLDTVYEVAVTCGMPGQENTKIEDTENLICYYLGDASLMYVLMVCCRLCEDEELKKKALLRPFWGHHALCTYARRV